MTLVRWEPIREIDSLQGEMNRLFDTFFGSDTANGESARVRRWMPAMDLVDAEDSLVLRADLPGLDHEDVSIEVKNGVLTVAGERKAEHADRGEGFYRVERSFGGFARSLTLPEGVDEGQISADFDRGVLEVRIPKPEERKPRRISIGAAASNGAIAEESADE